MSNNKKCQTSPQGSHRHFEYDENDENDENESQFDLDDNVEFLDEIQENEGLEDIQENEESEEIEESEEREEKEESLDNNNYYQNRNQPRKRIQPKNGNLKKINIIKRINVVKNAKKCIHHNNDPNCHECKEQCSKIICPKRSCFSECKPQVIDNLLNTIVTPIALTQDVITAITTVGSIVPQKNFTFNVRLPSESKIRIELLWSPTPIIRNIWQSINSAVNSTKILNPFTITVTLNIHSDGSVIDSANPIPLQNNSIGPFGGFSNQCSSTCNLFGFTPFSIQIITEGLDLTSGAIFGALSLINPQGVIFRNSSLPENQPNNDSVTAPTTIGFALYPDGNIIYYLGSITIPIIRPTSQYSPAIYVSFTHSCSSTCCGEAISALWNMINLTSLTL